MIHLAKSLLAAAVTAATLAGGLTGGAETPEPVAEWVQRNAVALATTDPGAPLDDLAPLATSLQDAEIVGLGESVHGASQVLTLKHRTLRFLVEELGFRSVAWEENWTTGLVINEYIQTGQGDVDAIVRGMSPQWQAGEIADVLRWLRDFNEGRTDKVEFVGVEYYFTGRLAYDAIDAYVAGSAPARLDEVREHLDAIRPDTSDAFAYAQWYAGLPDKEPYIRHAKAVQELVSEVPSKPLDRGHAIAMHHATQIVSYYEHYNLTFDESNVYREARAAENLRWWQQFSGDNVAYWAASPHVANAPELSIIQPSGEDFRFPSAGSYVRQWYGEQYVSIGFTFDHGEVRLGPDSTAEMPSPAENWFEHPFGDVDLDQLALDLRADAPAEVREWLNGAVSTRGLADSGPDGYMTGGSLEQWFDVIVHCQSVSPAIPS